MEEFAALISVRPAPEPGFPGWFPIPWGRRFIPSMFTITVHRRHVVEADPLYELDVRVIDGRPTCISLRSKTGLTSTTLRLPLEQVIRRGTALISQDGPIFGVESVAEEPVERRAPADADDERRRESRGPATHELAEVARVVRHAPDPSKPIKAIQDRFGVTRQHAHRLRDMALAAGHDLPPKQAR